MSNGTGCMSDKRFNTILRKMAIHRVDLLDLSSTKLGLLNYYAKHNLNNENFIEQSRLYPLICLRLPRHEYRQAPVIYNNDHKLIKRPRSCVTRFLYGSVAYIAYLLQNYDHPDLKHITIVDRRFENKVYVDIYHNILVYILDTCELIGFVSEKELASFIPLLTHKHVTLDRHAPYWIGMSTMWRCDTDLLQHTHIKMDSYYHSIILLSNEFAPTWVLLNQLLITDVSAIIQLHIIQLTYSKFQYTKIR
jgi:hypothetical protein